jgi:hypothetical protein
MILTGSDAFGAGAGVFGLETGYTPAPDVLISRREGDGLPRLPDSEPVAAPPMATMTSSTTVAPSVRSTAATKGRKKHKRRRFGKLILAMFVLAGLVGAALLYGRDYLFPEDWDKSVVPAVDALQLSSGLEFAEPVTVNTLPSVEYSARVSGFMFGAVLDAEWPTAIPRWRALGLVDGEPTVESVSAAVSTWKPAYYDPADGQIYRDATATGAAADVAIREALAAALVDQLTAGEPAPAADPSAPAVVVPPTASLARLAVADLGAELVAGPTTTESDPVALAALPVLLAHRLIGADDLGPAVLASVGVDPDRDTAIAGFDVDVAAALDVPWTAAPVPAMIEGDTQDGEAVARGSDFWYSVLASYLPAETAADAANSIVADLYVPAIRGAQQCVYGTFTAATPEVLGVLQIAAVGWAGAAPLQAGATATTLADGATVQLSTCDPGTAAGTTRTPDVASALVARQIARLSAV